jgi:hypothetical protein
MQVAGRPDRWPDGDTAHRKFKMNAPDWYEELYERQRKAHSPRRIGIEHGIAHLKNWRAPDPLTVFRLVDTLAALPRPPPSPP